MTEYEYLAICRGYEVKEGKVSHLFRYLSFITINLNVDKRGRIKDPTELWRIPAIDGEKKVETEEDRKANFENFLKLNEYFKRIDKKKKHARNSST